MTVRGLDHVNIATDDVVGTARFFVEKLGLRAISPGTTTRPGDAQWLLDPEDRAVIHLARPELLARAGHAVGEGPGSGAIHHIAFSCTGHDAMLDTLEADGLVERAFTIESMSLRQIFIRDPNGILVELNFFGD